MKAQLAEISFGLGLGVILMLCGGGMWFASWRPGKHVEFKVAGGLLIACGVFVVFFWPELGGR
jgi:hypothetical protein